MERSFRSSPERFASSPWTLSDSGSPRAGSLTTSAPRRKVASSSGSSRRSEDPPPPQATRNLLDRGPPIAPEAGELRCAVLPSGSREHAGAGPADATAFLNRLRDGDLHVFTNAGHHVMTEHPERWSALVGDFLLSPR